MRYPIKLEISRGAVALIQSNELIQNVFVCVAHLEQGRPGKDGTHGYKVSCACTIEIPLWKVLHVRRAAARWHCRFLSQPRLFQAT